MQICSDIYNTTHSCVTNLAFYSCHENRKALIFKLLGGFRLEMIFALNNFKGALI